MKIENATQSDFEAWLSLAREVEHLFGPMADDASFQKALKQAISFNIAFCVRCGNGPLQGAIVISRELNEILWFAVSGESRGKGYGKALLGFALDRLNGQKPVLVQTFDDTTPEGVPARKLYGRFGFTDFQKGGMNPAGVPTVIMQRPGA